MSAAPGDFGRSGCGHHASDSCSPALIVDKKEHDAYWGLRLVQQRQGVVMIKPTIRHTSPIAIPEMHRTETSSLRDAP